MNMKKALSFFMVLMLVIGFTAGCAKPGSQSSTGTKSGSSGTKKVSFEFWSAPNPPQTAFWKQMAKAYMKTHKNVTIKVTQMPSSPSSEAGIQTALSSGTAPTMSENIWRGFAAQLAKNHAIVPLDSFKQFSQIIKARHMSKTIKPWKFSDGHQYVIPLYSNAMLFGWRIDILKKLGYSQPPRTFSGIVKLGEKLKKKFPKKFLWARQALAQPTWSQRWFDFFMLYEGASGGNAFVKGNKLVANDKAAVQTLQFLHQLSAKNLLLTQKSTNPFVSGLEVFDCIGPWTFPTWKQKFPNFKYKKNFVLTMPPVMDGMDPSKAKTYADTKGLVIYSQSTKAQQQAAMNFAKWVLSNPKHDLKWLKETNLPPARDDLSTNPTFKAFFKKHPALEQYAKNIPNAVPAVDNPNTVKMQTLLSTAAVNPVVKGTTSAKQAWQAFKQQVNGVLGK